MSDLRPKIIEQLSNEESANFSEDYGRLRVAVREGAPAVSEHVVQCLWYDQLFVTENLRTADGQPLTIHSPGWWNHAEGPDFRGAQIEFGGTLKTGDIEIHLGHGAWKQHGHHLDRRYDDVILVVVTESKFPTHPPITSQGRTIPCLLLSDYLSGSVQELSETVSIDDYQYRPDLMPGVCAALAKEYGAEHVTRFVRLAGEWRLLNKARAIRERMERGGSDQAIYEAFLVACGFSRYKLHFGAIARQLPYDRVVQLARQDPLLVESAFLQMAGLLPGSLPERTGAVPHFARLCALREGHLGGLRTLPLEWSRSGVRPNNYPERRLAGAARFLARTSKEGITAVLEPIWREPFSPIYRRKAFEALFPGAMGFWAEHCTWTSKRLSKAVAPLGVSRVRSIIGNVFVPAALAMARQGRDRRREESVYAFFAALPKESENHVVETMVPRVFGDQKPPKLNFCLQQGLLQVYQDWCEPNPSCRNCIVIPFLDGEKRLAQRAGT